MKTKIYHNPRCSKSRETLALLTEQNEEIEIIEYLKDSPSKKELKQVLKYLKTDVHAIIRKSEDLYKTEFANKELSEDEWLEILIKHPVLIERPIVIKGRKAAIGRPPHTVLDIL